MVSRWATRRRALQNSPDASTSTRAVWTAIDASSPPPTCLDPLLLDLRQWSKKYLALPLWTMSNSVPAATNAIMMTTYVCMSAGDTDAESSANGLIVNTIVSPPSRRSSPRRCGERLLAVAAGNSKGRMRAPALKLGYAAIEALNAAMRGCAAEAALPGQRPSSRTSKRIAARSPSAQVAGAARPATVPGFTSQVRPPRTLATCSTPAAWEWPQHTRSQSPVQAKACPYSG